MINIEHLDKTYHLKNADVHAVDDVSLHIESGQIYGVIGYSGAGKSTLLHILGTLDVPDEGVLSIDGEVLTNMKEKTLAKYRNQNLGFVFQFHHLLDEFTALENVCIPAYIAKTNQKIVERKAKELLDYLGLKDRMDHKPNQLSGGEQQRVAVARALINQPKVVLADEPTGNLDNTSSREMHELFLKLRNDFNQTFVIVTHNEELAQMSNKRYFMVDGKIDSID